MDNLEFICVSGFFSSGSSAVVDLLKEYKGVYECKAEIRMIKDPYGITQMEDSLVHRWELINSSAAIWDFLDLCKICARPGRFPLASAGLGYSKTINPNFMRISEDYVEKLTKYKYITDFYYSKFKKNYFKYVADRCRWAVEYLTKGKIKVANRKLRAHYFAQPTQAEFNVATQEYFETLFEDKGCQGIKHIILDQAISPNNTQVIHRYFKSAKMIIIDRDPRDMYADDLLWAVNYDADWYSAEAGKRYVLRQKALRSNMVLDKDILYIKFEELVFDYDNTVERIEKFLGLSQEEHIEKNKYFNPEVSKKNVGIWKTKYEECQDAIDVINAELEMLCFKR